MNSSDGTAAAQALAALARFWHEVGKALLRGLQRGHY